MLPTSAGVEPATSWSPVGRRIQLSHRGRQTLGLRVSYADMKISSLKSTFKVKLNDEKLSKLILPSNLTKVMLSTEKQPILT